MAYANVQTSGKLETNTGAGISWTPGAGPTLNNLLTQMSFGFTAGNYVPGASDVKDSSGTPKTYNLDVNGNVTASGSNCAIYRLIVPSGLTTPLKNVNTATVLVGAFDEWSGNATSSVLDQTAKAASAASGTGGNTTNITTGANAGLALAVVTKDGNAANEGIATTGTSFSVDVVEQSNSSFQAGSCDDRTASVASATIQDSWTWTGGSNTYAACIASYNVPAAGGAAVLLVTQRRVRGAGG